MQDENPHSFIEICTIKILVVAIPFTQKVMGKLLHLFENLFIWMSVTLDKATHILPTVGEKNTVQKVIYFISMEKTKWKQ